MHLLNRLPSARWLFAGLLATAFALRATSLMPWRRSCPLPAAQPAPHGS